jgi:hypothetical protein
MYWLLALVFLVGNRVSYKALQASISTLLASTGVLQGGLQPSTDSLLDLYRVNYHWYYRPLGTELQSSSRTSTAPSTGSTRALQASYGSSMGLLQG